MKFEHRIKPRDAKNNPITAGFAAVFVMFIVSGLLLLLLSLLLYKLEPEESVIRIGIIVIYVISGFAGGLLTGKMMREQKFLWGLAAGVIYFAVLLLVSLLVRGSFEVDMARVVTTFALCAASGMAGGMVS